jgi:hypothetical protein
MIFTAVNTQAIKVGFNALNPVTGTCTQGDQYPEAVSYIKEEATSFYLEEFSIKVQSHPLVTTVELAQAQFPRVSGNDILY